MSPAKGRPPSKDPKRNDTRIRLTDSEAEKLEYCSQKTGMTKADVIRKGIDMVYAEVTKKQRFTRTLVGYVNLYYPKEVFSRKYYNASGNFFQ